ncbi:hypothetical protein ACFMPD_06085 [Sedimentitalea sp. HM32M-2]|uniref:hypothetical protein n=1 Tax=Sedimentitalea sp. HM32M-2 TaxID=3351566 RepID=UPI00363306CA
MTRREITAAALGVALSLVAGAVSAQTGGQGRNGDQSGLARMLEVRAHQALIERIGRDDAVLAPFATDGCSGGLSDVWRMVSARFPDFAAAHEDRPPWEPCCVVHDAAYHDGTGGGTAEAGYAARLQADAALRLCVIDIGETRKRQLAEAYDIDSATVIAGYEVIADAMYLAVRLGGAPCSGLSWRWGFGWPDCDFLTAAPPE